MIPCVVNRVAGMRREQADDFGYIERRAATKTDYAVRAMRTIGRRARHHLAGHGVALNASKHAHFQVMQAGFKLRQQWQRLDALVRHDQRTL